MYAPIAKNLNPGAKCDTRSSGFYSLQIPGIDRRHTGAPVIKQECCLAPLLQVKPKNYNSIQKTIQQKGWRVARGIDDMVKDHFTQ